MSGDFNLHSLKQNSMLQAEIKIGDGLPVIRLTTKCLEALKQAGFEVNIDFL
jgi:sterol 24-C-methyltransferase